MILHIITDEKFIDIAYKVFEEAQPHQNSFMLITNNKKIKFIKDTPFELFSYYDFFTGKIAKHIDKFDVLIVHSLTKTAKLTLKYKKEHQKVVWIGWGFDYYNYITKNNFSSLLKMQTKILYRGSKSFYLHKLKYFIEDFLFDKNKVFDKIDFFAPVIEEDFNLLQKSENNIRFTYLDWNYGNLEDYFIKGFEDRTVNGNNILIGNSSSFENNHLDAFNLLDDLNLEDRIIYTPLSYGNSNYKNNIIEVAEKKFQDNFVALTHYIPLEEYINIIISSPIVIMNHLRQQAVGNIIIMMYLGAKIFLDEKNPVYDFFKQQDAYIYKLDELKNEYKGKLDILEINHNREILKKNWSKEIILFKTKMITYEDMKICKNVL